MTLEIEILQLGRVRGDSSFEVKDHNPGNIISVRCVCYLIHGLPEGLVLVDSGFRSPEIMETIGMRTVVHEGEGLEAELAKRSIRLSDIRYLLHTHLHIDHAGKDDLFPFTTTVIMNRSELASAAGGLASWAYPQQDVKHLVDRVYTKDAACLLDVEKSAPVEIFDGIAVEYAGGHSTGSINVLIETSDGVANICGDVVYSIERQYVNPFQEIAFNEPRISGNTVQSQRDEKAAIKRIFNKYDWVLPMHDAPARLDRNKRIAGRIAGTRVPGVLAK
jgi:glyoxylase-like metal-dependent hydrolase (beta-lactamase superfamily II)